MLEIYNMENKFNDEIFCLKCKREKHQKKNTMTRAPR